MPKYAKYLRNVVANKLQDVETVALTEECSAMMTQKMPKKLKDPRKFNLLIQIGNNEMVQAFSDLRVSINLIHLSLFKTLGLGKPRPCTVRLQLADGSTAYSKEIIEDVFIKEDEQTPIILGYPILAIGGVLIDDREGTLTMRLEDEEAIFKFYKVLNIMS
ncbi:uncharacterized protein LOC124899483 [Capsicum annuum]|uniref:uncharacterized protein LOC124899483 n=1 Tax=Capsicum annuum TaxID=4072 RepID=UPI001FB14E26|nr:uncharacterized protein LOC124899483 [Capsicum annuum]